MSEITVAPVAPRRSFTRIIVIVIGILLLLLVYGAGFVALPISILTNYQHKNCDSVLSLNNLYTSMYPGFVRDHSLSSQVKECEAYGMATSNEEDGLWQDSYDSYQAYTSAYPSGLFAKEAHEHSAIVLMNIAKDQDSQKQYDEEMKNLSLIISSYSDTGVSADAWNMIPSTYASWGTGLRKTGDFQKSEQVLNDFKTWAETNQRNEPAASAKKELAQTYVTWGQNLQTQKQYEEAIAKFEKAAMAAPESAEAVAEAKADQRKAYLEWGNTLLEQNELSAAMEKFEKAVSLADGDKDDGARDALSKGHIQWAASLTKDEDFLGALDQLEIARQSAISDTMKKSVDTALNETYVAFSNSSGTQARRAMKDALTTICKQHKKPQLPIFGLNKDLVHLSVYGADVALPENLIAKTPGELHYVACIDAQNHTIQSRLQRFIIDRTARGYYYTIVQQFRAEIVWDINLVALDTGKTTAETSLTGGTPPPFPEGNAGGGYTLGLPPSVDDLSEWLESVIK